MDNGKRFALRMAALMLCLLTVSAALSSCGFFADSYLENNTGIAVKTQGKSEPPSPETTVELIPETTLWEDTTELPETEKTPETTKDPATTAPETTKAPETTVPETTLSPEQLDNIPDDVQHHVYLTHKNTGRCEELIGKVSITVVMVSDEVSVWNDAALNALSASLSSQEKDIEKLAATYGKDLDITFSYLGAKVAGDAAAGDYSEDWINAATQSIGYESVKTMQKELDAKNSADSNPILFALNKTGRAYANYSTGKTGCEYLVVFSSDSSSFNHELYHVYGAQDFYYPAEVKDLANTYLTGSIMSDGDVTDPLTAFIIGWDDEIDTEAYEFLKKTSYLTKELIDEANKAQSVTGNVTDYKLDYGTYTGYLERGVPTGEGTLIYLSGDVATGTFSGGQLNGKGHYTWANGDKYEGDFVNSVRTGKGTYYWNDSGNTYTGDFVDGLFNGEGTFTFASGDKYVGSFKDNNFHGGGVYTTPDGYKYEGAWKNGQREGYGVAVWADGSKYEGNWSDGKWNGAGTYYYASGSKYVGNFKDHNFDGQGVYTTPEGYKYDGAWKDGKREGYGVASWANGDVYSGSWSDNNMNGQGTYKYGRGHEYTGAWENGSHSGYGTMKWADGSTYEGNWKNSKRHGYGKFVNNKGEVFEGQWYNDVFKG